MVFQDQKIAWIVNKAQPKLRARKTNLCVETGVNAPSCFTISTKSWYPSGVYKTLLVLREQHKTTDQLKKHGQSSQVVKSCRHFYAIFTIVTRSPNNKLYFVCVESTIVSTCTCFRTVATASEQWDIVIMTLACGNRNSKYLRPDCAWSHLEGFVFLTVQTYYPK